MLCIDAEYDRVIYRSRNSGLTCYSLDDLVLELLGTAPLADAGEAVGVTAAGQDAKAPLGWRRFVVHHLHTNTADLVLTLLRRERLLHILLERHHTHLKSKDSSVTIGEG